jgi:uncharacterized protein (DUF58 family)
LVDSLWLVVLAALGGWALWGGHQLLFLCVVLGLLVSGSILVTRRFSLTGVSYRRQLSAARAQLGEVVELAVAMENRKLLPVASLYVEDELPRHLALEGATVRPARDHLAPALAIGHALYPYQRVVQRFRVSCRRRGRHRFGPARCEAGDFLGARPHQMMVHETAELLVFPKVFPLLLSRGVADCILGRDPARRLPFTDPLRRVGARPYAPGDPVRLIDWRATARSGAIMVNELEPSSTPTMQIALDFRVRNPQGDRFEPDELELAISVAASLAAHASQRKWRIGLLGNGVADGVPIRVPASRSPAQLGAIFDALACAASVPAGSFAELLLAGRPQAQRSTIVITTGVDAELAAALARLWRAGASLLLVLVAADGAAASAASVVDLPPLPVVRIPYQPGWENRDELVLTA